MAELADAGDLKSPGGNTVWVRPPPALPNILGIPSTEPQYMGHRSLLIGKLFVLCAVCVQIEYHDMELKDTVVKITTIYGTANTQCYQILPMDVEYEDLSIPFLQRVKKASSFQISNLNEVDQISKYSKVWQKFTRLAMINPFSNF